MHVPVLVNEVLEGLNLSPGGIYVDGTLGLGGHSEAMFQRCPEIEIVLGLDRDSEALEQARRRLAGLGNRIWIIHSNFVDLPEILFAEGIGQVDGILLDIGLSSFQLEKSGRGFSFTRDEPLDMRMDGFETVTAADMVNHLPVTQLTDLIRTYGEERWAKRIAARIDEARKRRPIRTSAELASIVYRAIPKRFHSRRIHPATRTFQALRIAVNKELDNLKLAMQRLPECLKPGGRLCIISFHSLEDRIVKHAIRQDQRLEPLTKKPIMAAPEELEVNPRARSAKLRIARKKTDP